MELKSTYIAPQCVLKTVRVYSVVCASAWLDPLQDDDETIDWDD